uniref:Bifunctional inhibitor/plant lipid transfer protein/seed storage helical domain-containing protein n=1 Tax=Kalanchoe fedtschenkoi TaxID=63787 RepID=A0A7N0VJ26_KALFE
MMTSRLAFILLAALLLLADLAASQSPTASPSPAPSRRKKTPVSVPVESPAPTAPAPDAGTDCMTLLFGAADCLSYVEEGSNLTVPEKACCPELATLVNTNPICLCQLLNKGNSLGIAIDVKKALALPSACKVQTPDPSLCALINGGPPAGAPGLSPTDGQSPTGAGLPPSSVNNDNGASALFTSATTFAVALLAVSVSAFTWNMF